MKKNIYNIIKNLLMPSTVLFCLFWLTALCHANSTIICKPITQTNEKPGTVKAGLQSMESDKRTLYMVYNENYNFANNEPGYYLRDLKNKKNIFTDFKSDRFIVVQPWIRNCVADILSIGDEPSSLRFIKSDSTRTLKKITDKLNIFTKEYLIEKAYLHLDKPYYATGDTIYFKAYVAVGAQHKLSAISGVLNVDLIKPDEKIYRSVKLQLIDGVAWGDCALDDTLKAGNYRIRAYTNWMRNADEDYFFNHNLLVADGYPSNRKPDKLNINASDKNSKAPIFDGIHGKYDVQFFPEGGSLITGVPTKIGFKAVSSNGLGTSIAGIVTDNEGNQILSFHGRHLGMGEFTLNPEPEKTYKASITFEDGSTAIFHLQKASNTGYALRINCLDSTRLKINITAGKLNPAAQILLVAQSGGNIYYTAKSSANAKDINAIIPNNRFPTGIVQFTLFSSAGEPLNERLVFINNNDQLHLGISTPLQSYAVRQNVRINLDAKDKNGQPVTGLFSVSVTDETKVPPNENAESNILSSLLLTSDIKGHIEQPNYYFTNITDDTRADLDVLMLTQGYHRFEWKQLLTATCHQLFFSQKKFYFYRE